MLSRFRTRLDQTRDEGFTLIELLVVIIIIGILAAIAIPVFLSQKTKGYEASEKSDLRAVAEEVESQNVDKGDYTATTWKTAATAAVANATITGTGQIVGISTTVNLSPGNTVTWIGSTISSYCLKATSSKSGTSAWYYSNTAGGISKNACTS